MTRLALLATVASLALTGAAFAQTGTNAPPATQPSATTQAPATSSMTSSQPKNSTNAASSPSGNAMNASQGAATPPASSPGANANPTSPVSPSPAAQNNGATAMPMRQGALTQPSHARHYAARRREMRRMAMRRMAARHATHLAKRETKALNLLEAKGYGNFRNFHREGRVFAAMVLHHGQPERVMINPDTGSVTRRG